MNITDYKTIKALDMVNKTSNVKISLINGTPALTVKKYNPGTGELLSDVEQIGINVDGWKQKVVELQNQIDNINEFIKDCGALK